MIFFKEQRSLLIVKLDFIKNYIWYMIHDIWNRLYDMMWPNLVVNTRGREFILYDHHYDPKHSHHLRSLKNALFQIMYFRTQNIPRHSRWSFSVFQKVFSADLAGDWAWGEQLQLQVDISFFFIYVLWLRIYWLIWLILQVDIRSVLVRRSCVQRILFDENISQSFGRVCLPGFCRQVDWLLFQPLETSLRNT